MKKTLAFLVLFCMILTVTACSNSNSGTPASSAGGAPQTGGTSSAGQPPVLPLSTDGATLSIGAHDSWYSAVSFANDLECWQVIREMTGITIDWQVYGDDFSDVMNMRLAAGVDIPDILSVPGDPLQFQSVLLNFSDYMDEHGYYSSKYLEENPLVKAETVAPDGNIYFFPSVISGTDNGDPYGWMVRKDWLEKVGIERDSVKTPDDWANMLRAFRDQDPNGNGQQDEIPMTSQKYGQLARLGGAWDLHLMWMSDGWYFDDAGKVVYEPLKPEYKEFVKFANLLYSEDLLDKDYMNVGSEQVMSLVTRDIVGIVTHFINNVEAYDKALRDAGINGEFDMMVPVVAEGYKGVQERYGISTGATAISAKTKDPVLAFKFLDWFWASKECNYLMTFGIEGKTYEMKDGEPTYLPYATENPEGLGLSNVIRALGGFPTICWIRGDKGELGKQPFATIAHKPKMVDFVNRVQPYLEFPFPQVRMSADDAAEYVLLNTDITKMRDEIIGGLIAGTIPMDQYESRFTDRLKEMNVDRLIELKQAAYDNFVAATK